MRYLFVFLFGCGGPPAAVQTALNVTAHAVVAVDNEFAPLYGEAADECRDASSSWDAYDACLGDWIGAHRALSGVHRGLFALQRGVDAWEDGTDEGARFTDAVPCLVASAVEMLRLFELLEVEIPDEFVKAVALLQAFGGTCDG